MKIDSTVSLAWHRDKRCDQNRGEDRRLKQTRARTLCLTINNEGNRFDTRCHERGNSPFKCGRAMNLVRWGPIQPPTCLQVYRRTGRHRGDAAEPDQGIEAARRRPQGASFLTHVAPPSAGADHLHDEPAQRSTGPKKVKMMARRWGSLVDPFSQSP